MNLKSKKITATTFLALSLATCAPTLYAADAPTPATNQEAPTNSVTDEQIRKDWPEVMRMVSRTHAKLNQEELYAKVIGCTAVAAIVLAGIFSLRGH